MKVINAITERTLDWYAHHQRDLYWRHTRDPYLIWVSEIMLQQTQVETVIPYFRRFLSMFPTVQALAKASQQDVLKAWENMGYYARARNLHAAARQVVSNLEGKIPRSREALLSLPGIGPYTASAILSFAFGQRVPTLDGNVRRVLCRLFAIRTPLGQTQTERRLSELARDMVPDKDPSSFNQGLMDLGSAICTPKRPSCARCPLQEFCQAFQLKLQETLPITKKRGLLPQKQMTAGIIRNGQDRLLIVQRPSKGLLGGLWKFPGGERKKGEGLRKAIERTVMEELGVLIHVDRELATVKHAYSHFRITLHPFHCALTGGRPRALGCTRWQWIQPHRLPDVPFSRAERKILEVMGMPS